MTESIAKQWLPDIVSTTQQHDLGAHMNLLSKNTQGIDCLLEIESDGQWHLVEQRILSNHETHQYLPELSGVH